MTGSDHLIQAFHLISHLGNFYSPYIIFITYWREKGHQEGSSGDWVVVLD
jgi:hypothetical protein